MIQAAAPVAQRVALDADTLMSPGSLEAARAADKDVTYVEIEGQGHHIEGQERVVEAWQARLDFIAKVLSAE